MIVNGDLDLRDLRAAKPVRLSGARVKGNLILSGAKIGSRSGEGLIAESIDVSGHLVASGATFTGEVRIINASIGGSVTLDAARFTNPGAVALRAEGMRVKGSLFARTGTQVDGEFSLLRASINGSLTLDGADVKNVGGVSVNLDGVDIEGDLHCRVGFRSTGEFRALGGSIGGTMNLSGGTFAAPGARSLSLDRCTVEGSLLCREGFLSEGLFCLIDASIGREFSLDGALLLNAGDDVIRGYRVSIGTQIYVRSDTRLEGTLQLTAAKVGRSVDFSECSLTAPGRGALELRGAEISGTLHLRPKSLDGYVDLRSASSEQFIDNDVARSAETFLRGFRYNALLPEPPVVDVRARLEWLRRDPEGYSPSTYAQVAKVWRDRGHAEQARAALMTSQQTRRLQGVGLNKATRRIWSSFLRWTIGYGYRPWLGVIWLIALLIVGSLWIKLVPRSDFIKVAGAPPFNCFLYTLDNLLPFVDMGYSKWVPTGVAQIITSAVIVAGWILVTALVAALSGILRRGD